MAPLTEPSQDYETQSSTLAAEQSPAAAPRRRRWDLAPVRALSFGLTLADPPRFTRSRELGGALVRRPQRRQSGERDPPLGSTPAGHTYLRWLLGEGAPRLLRVDAPDRARKRGGRSGVSQEARTPQNEPASRSPANSPSGGIRGGGRSNEGNRARACTR
jgi:hypothetical protein